MCNLKSNSSYMSGDKSDALRHCRNTTIIRHNRANVQWTFL